MMGGARSGQNAAAARGGSAQRPRGDRKNGAGSPARPRPILGGSDLVVSASSVMTRPRINQSWPFEELTAAARTGTASNGSRTGSTELLSWTSKFRPPAK